MSEKILWWEYYAARPKVVCLTAVMALMLVLVVFAAGFAAGLLWTADDAFELGRKATLEQVRAEIREAAHDGRPFFIQGSDVRLIPHVRSWEIAGAGADVRVRNAR